MCSNYLDCRLSHSLEKKKKFILSVYVDFNKSLATVKHDLLLHKQKLYEIRGKKMPNRTQSTISNNNISVP